MMTWRIAKTRSIIIKTQPEIETTNRIWTMIKKMMREAIWLKLIYILRITMRKKIMMRMIKAMRSKINRLSNKFRQSQRQIRNARRISTQVRTLMRKKRRRTYSIKATAEVAVEGVLEPQKLLL